MLAQSTYGVHRKSKPIRIPYRVLEASVKNVLSTIKETEAEMTSSRQLRKPA